MADVEIKEKQQPEDVRAVFAALGIESSGLTSEQVEKKSQIILETLSGIQNKGQSSIDLAYQISVDYFASSIARFDAIDNKVQNLFTFAVGIFAIAPVLIKLNANTQITPLFWIGIGFLILSGLISISARLYGKLKILNPKVIFDKTLELEPLEFKKSVISSAGNAYEHNSRVIENKHRLNVASMFVFGAALVFLIYWLVQYAL